MKNFLKEEFIKFWFGLIATTLGVLIALLVNSYVAHQEDKAAYNAMLKAISYEAYTNKRILEESFETQVDSGIIRREFNTKTCDDFMVTKTFLSYAPSQLDSLLINYTLNLKRANNFRAADERYKYDSVLDRKWGQDLRIALKRTISNCSILIDRTILETTALTRN